MDNDRDILTTAYIFIDLTSSFQILFGTYSEMGHSTTTTPL